MKQIYLVSLFILLLFTNCYVNGIIYERIPKYSVGHFLSDFLEQRMIYDCFKKEIHRNLLYLKCLKERKIVDIIISIYDGSEKSIMV